jgi:Predicted membrane protein
MDGNLSAAACVFAADGAAGILAGTAVLSYFLGCFNGAVLISKYILHDDIRTHGSGNAGLTNFYRVFGGNLTLVVILTDFFKALIAIALSVLLARGAVADPAGLIFVKYWAGLFCLLGHMFPCMFRFRGGKGILSGGAMTLAIDWRIALVVWVIFFTLAIVTKYVSLGSVCCAAAFPVSTWFVYHDGTLLALAAITGGLVIWQHRGNVRRLMSGTESKFKFHHHEKTEGQK